MTDIKSFYDKNAQYEWERLAHNKTTFAVTMCAFRDYLPKPPARILDIGGGPGRYAIALAQQGYGVTLLDLSKNCLDFAKDKAKEADVKLMGYVQGTASDLTQFSQETYDVALLMGPLYHLLSTEERQKAVLEAKNVLKSDGLIFATFITRYAPIRYAAKHEPQWIVEHHQRLEELLATGILTASSDRGRFTDAYYAHPSEIIPFMEKSGCETLDLIACEGVISMIEDQMIELAGEFWQAWVELNYRLGKDPTVQGSAKHLLYVGRKK